ncbi:hypothetical protein Pyn_22651 [Prunus yedoensis var. nudiflora]|uniref:Uncharacterized protein n=1 Tax=Prunus yedoensis var. nudiflora TaxID=2094558 RepID=A0A314UD32_PRUYE|nr:hypothetical protein Pyn_22651 [Prunus yedoensis var. nudiflora]
MHKASTSRMKPITPPRNHSSTSSSRQYYDPLSPGAIPGGIDWKVSMMMMVVAAGKDSYWNSGGGAGGDIEILEELEGWNLGSMKKDESAGDDMFRLLAIFFSDLMITY